jgi:tetratricopeptide (TPR) repeat protein
MAKAFTQTILDSNLLGLNRPLPPPQPLPDDETFRRLRAVTPLDLTIAEYRIKMLTSGWPFKPHGRFITVEDLDPQTRIEKLAVAVLRKQSNYEKAHVELAEYYLEHGQADEALAEYRALAATFPTNESPYMALGRILIRQRRFAEALPILERTLNLVEDPFSVRWAGTIYLNQQRARKALPLLQRATELFPDDPQVLYNLSGAYFLTGDTARALTTIETVLERYPGFPNARNFYNQLLQVYRERRSL